MVIADLHTHSTASDGQYPPSEVVRKAKNAGIKVMALTDHDTLDGVDGAIETGKKLGIQVLRGVELGAAEYKNLHILGYEYKEKAPAMRSLCKKLRDSRDERKYRIIDYLKEKGIVISLEEVEEMAGGKVIARPHFARVMVKRGYVTTTREAFDRYLDTDEYQKIERWKADACTCMEAIHADGGMVSLAHPYQLYLENSDLDKLVRKLTENGLDAIECYYPKHTPEQIEFYCMLADRYGLHRTGGSDFHGEKVKPDIHLGGVPLELDWLISK